MVSEPSAELAGVAHPLVATRLAVPRHISERDIDQRQRRRLAHRRESFGEVISGSTQLGLQPLHRTHGVGFGENDWRAADDHAGRLRFALLTAIASGVRAWYFVESGTTIDPLTMPFARVGAGVGPWSWM
jgi:hypothetical protein